MLSAHLRGCFILYVEILARGVFWGFAVLDGAGGSCVVDEDALQVSASRLGKVDGPQLVSSLHGDTTLIQVTPPLQLRIEEGGCVGLSAEYEALPGFEVTGRLRSSSISWLPCPQERLKTPGAAVGAAVGSMNREKVSWKKAGGGDRRGECRRV